jgi:hypothetical protein
MKHGLIGLSAKPYHRGHDSLVRIGLKECDDVSVFVSTSDRVRPGEAPVLWRDMGPLWQRHIQPSLGERAKVMYGGSPIRHIYETIGKENDAGSEDTYVIYSDPEDLEKNFPPRAMEKYAGDLYAKGRIILEPVQRTATCQVSGTQMREWLAEGAVGPFTSHLPACLPPTETWQAMRETFLRMGRVRQPKR